MKMIVKCKYFFLALLDIMDLLVLGFLPLYTDPHPPLPII